MMDKHRSAAEDHTTNETTANSLSKQFHTQIGEQTTKETSDYTIIETSATMHTDSESTVDKKRAFESVEDLERRLDESRRFADEMQEKLRCLIERNRNIVGWDQ